MTRPLRIAMLAHSTNPRGGVVHALELSEALTGLGHQVTLHAPDARGTGFFRKTSCETVAIPVAPAVAGMTGMVVQRINDYVEYFAGTGTRAFDIFHAHDGISGNALATLKQRGLIHGFARTVHHIDTFADPVLVELQDRSIAMADVRFAVSGKWRSILANDMGLSADIVSNGVDLRRYAPQTDSRDEELRQKLGLGTGPVFLNIGGIEQRKNSYNILEAFLQFRSVQPDAQLVIAGGVSLLDHHAYQLKFSARLRAAGVEAANVHLVGAIDDNDMPALFRLADVLVFASFKEGFGLVVLEAMASGTPVIVSSIEPFIEYLSNEDVVWCDPHQPGTIADAMVIALNPLMRSRLLVNGFDVAKRHDWTKVARAHLPAYQRLLEGVHA
jgi:glycosyltransferase-like protein